MPRATRPPSAVLRLLAAALVALVGAALLLLTAVASADDTAPPIVTGLSPASGGTTSFDTTVTGSNFTGATEVDLHYVDPGGSDNYFANGPDQFTVVSDTEIDVHANSQQAPAGVYDVVVDNANFRSAVNPSAQYTVTDAIQPPHASIDVPNVAVFGTSEDIAISARSSSDPQNLDLTYAWSSPNCPNSIQSADEIMAQISLTLPNSTSEKECDITLEVSNGTLSNIAHGSVTLRPGAPTVTSISPTHGPSSGGTSVVITGTNLFDPTAVSFEGGDSPSFTSVSSTEIDAVTPAGDQGSSSDVTVTIKAGDGIGITPAAPNGAGVFAYDAIPTPTVTSVAPDSGPTAGGTPVTITGTNLTGATAVDFGTAPATSFNVVSPTQIAATSPPNSGPVDVTVKTPGGRTLASPASAFTYVTPAPTPTITSLSPNHGDFLGGYPVVITGSAFTGATAVTFDGSGAIFVTNSDGEITATAPADIHTGAVDVVVTNGSGSSPAATFTYDGTIIQRPVAEITPSTQSATGQTNTFQLDGTASHDPQGLPLTYSWVVCGGIAPFSFIAKPQLTLDLTNTGLASINCVVTLTVSNGTYTATISGSVTLNAEAPVVSSISPSTGPTSGGTPVTITGTNFYGVTAVTFGGTAATGYTVDSKTQITATTPPGSEGLVSDVFVTNTAGKSQVVGGDKFTYHTPLPPAPAVTSVSPTSGPVTGGTAVTITGTNFTNATGVAFGGATAVDFTVNSATQITAVTPAGNQGTVDVTIAAPGGSSPLTAADQFTYVAVPTPPTITSISPSHGPSIGGTDVVITGQNLSNVTGVSFSGTPAQTFTAVSSTEVDVLSPAHSAGFRGDVTVSTNIGTSVPAANGAGVFFWDIGPGTPVINSVTPNHGPNFGSTPVTISGSNFTGATAVKFGDANALTFAVNSDTSITARTPAGSGNVDVTVTTPDGTSPGAEFFYEVPLPNPSVTSVNPKSGPAAGGTPVTITGEFFLSGDTVRFGSAVATNVDVVSSTQITATSPAGTGSVDVSVMGENGLSPFSTADLFNYVAPILAPTVAGVFPATGSTIGGTPVFITGANFTGATAVKFGVINATSVVVNSATQITALSPPGAGVVDLTVSTPGGTSTTSNADKFTYVTPVDLPPVITSLSPPGGPVQGGNAVAIHGFGLLGVRSVKFGNIVVAPQTDTDTTVTVIAPAHLGGSVPVSVSKATLTSGTLPYAYVDNNQVSLSLFPSSGPVSGGTSVYLELSDFGGISGISSFTVDGVHVPYTLWNPGTAGSFLTFTTPVHAIGQATVALTDTAGTAVGAFTYVATPAPANLSLNPNAGSQIGGTVVTLSGSNLIGVQTVTLAGGEVAFTQNAATGQIRFTTRAHPPGSVLVVVTTLTGSGSVNFRYIDTSPSNLVLNPNRGPQIGGTSVTVTGTNLAGAKDVSVGGVSVSFSQNPINSRVTFTTKPHAPGGTTVVVTTASGSASATFTFLTTPPPSNLLLTPANGPQGGGTSVLLTGNNIDNATIAVDGSPQKITEVNGKITFTTPAHAPGSVPFTVTTSAGSTAVNFHYIATPPGSLSLNPSNGPQNGGTAVILRGVNLDGATSVTVGPTSVSFGETRSTPGNPAFITFRTPGSAAGSAPVVVTTPTGTASVNFTFNREPAPSNIVLTPNAGSQVGGTLVTLSGSTIDNASSVSVGGVLVRFTQNPVNQRITFTAPAHTPGAVPVVVTTAAGAGSANFTYR